MLIDWLTLFIDASLLPEATRARCNENVDKILRISPTGELRWGVNVREQVRSDSHEVTIEFGSRLCIKGSPARIKNKNNVFGSLDIQQCAKDMIRFVAVNYQVFIPLDLKLWSCSKIDVTRNYDMGSLDQVLASIDAMKPIKVGRQKQVCYDSSVTWGHGSTLHMGKVYAKGPQIKKLIKKQTAILTDSELQKADRLLRLEYSIRRVMISRLKDCGRHWYQLEPEHLLSMHNDYFSKFISSVEVTDMENILDKILAHVGEGGIPTHGRAVAAYGCYLRCREVGVKQAKSSYLKSAWYTHLKNLRIAGIGEVDMQPMNVVPLRKRQVFLDKPV